jgi:hypothetical protein
MGAVLGISFLETPLKFRAPGITTALGLGIGRKVFRALNAVEVAFAVALAILTRPIPQESRPEAIALAALWAVLLCQIIFVRPRLERRTRDVLAGVNGPRSRMHLFYVLLEAVKILLLPALGALQLARIAG